MCVMQPGTPTRVSQAERELCAIMASVTRLQNACWIVASALRDLLNFRARPQTQFSYESSKSLVGD